MVYDLLLETPDPENISDFCVVGAGAAGIALTVELVRLGKRVTLLESGGRKIESDTQGLYASEVVGAKHVGIHDGRFRVHGGTTTKWGGQILELNEIDFEAREWIPGSGWPILKADLAPFYARALEIEGLSKAIRSDEVVWSSLGVAPPSISNLECYFTRWCPQPNFAKQHKSALEGTSVSVWLHANAISLVRKGSAAVGVQCRTLQGKAHAFLANKVIFCLGGIECVRFFLQPQRDGAPWNDSGLLGSHFNDHISAEIAVVRPTNKTFYELFDNVYLSNKKYHPRLRLRPDRQRERGTLNVSGSLEFRNHDEESIAAPKRLARKLAAGLFTEIELGEVLESAIRLPSAAKRIARLAIEHRAYNYLAKRVHLRVHCEQEPRGSSRITLSNKVDSLGMLKVRLDWRTSPLEFHSIRAFAEVARESLGFVADVDIASEVLSPGSGFGAKCSDSNHHIGGMRMAADSRLGVVDLDLRVHGIDNCYVCSAAVFPTGGFSNPTHTVIALAVRLARHLISQS